MENPQKIVIKIICICYTIFLKARLELSYLERYGAVPSNPERYSTASPRLEGYSAETSCLERYSTVSSSSLERYARLTHSPGSSSRLGTVVVYSTLPLLSILRHIFTIFLSTCGSSFFLHSYSKFKKLRLL